MSRPINNNDDLFQLFSEMINNRQNSYFNNLSITDIETLYRRVLSLSDSEREYIVDNAVFNMSLSDFLPPDWSGKQYSRDEYDLAENHFDNLRESFMEETEMKVEGYDYRLTKEVKNVILELYYETNAYELDNIVIQSKGKFYFAKDSTLRPVVAEKIFTPEVIGTFKKSF